MADLPERAEELLEFWFAGAPRDPATLEERLSLWFTASAAFDAALEERFGALTRAAAEGALDAWTATPRGAVALLLLLDQLPRNLWRDDPRAFASDERAQGVALDCIARGIHERLHPVEAMFLATPFIHAEDLALQDRYVAYARWNAERAEPSFRALLSGSFAFAEGHREVIARFGRFPHRNAVLGRVSTKDEERYLREERPPHEPPDREADLD